MTVLIDHHHHHVQEGLVLIPVPCILKMKLVPPSISSSVVLSVFVLLVYIVVLVQVSCLCPSSVCVVATFPGTVLFFFTIFSAPVFFPLIHWFFLYLVLLFQEGVLKISSVLLLNVVPLFSSVPRLHFRILMQVQRHQGGSPTTRLTLRRAGNLSR